MKKKIPSPIRIKGELAESILKCIIEGFQDYSSLSKKLSRHRSTIEQSIKKLLSGHYIEEEKIKPSKAKQISLFQPTSKGVYYCIAFFDMDIGIFLKFMDEKEKQNLHEFISQSPNSSESKKFWKNTAIALLHSNLFQDGELKVTIPEDLFNLGCELGDLAAKRGMMTIDDNLDKSTVIQTVKESVPTLLVHDVKQFIENRKLKGDDEFNGITSKMENL